MKHLALAAACITLLTAPAWGQWSEDFQAYTVGSQISGQGGWAGWDGGTFATAVVAADPAGVAGNNAGKVVTSNNVVREVTGLTSGTWVFTAMQYIPSSAHVNSSTNSVAYVNLMNKYVSAGAKGYGAGLNFNLGTAAATSDTVTDAQTGGVRPVVFDQWVPIRVEINLDSNFRAVYYNSALLGVTRWYNPADANQAQSIAAVDLQMGANAAAAAYYDDLAIAAGSTTACPPAGTEDFQSYAVGSTICGQCSWAGWDGDVFNAIAAADPDTAAPPGNKVIEEHSGNDMVQQYWGYASGAWVYRIRQYIPSSQQGKTSTSFILMNKYTIKGGKGWAVSLGFDLTNNVIRDGEAGEGGIPIVYDKWMTIEVEIDLDANIRSTYYVDTTAVPVTKTRVGTSRWYDEYDSNHAKSIAAVDLWADAADFVYYDDISITAGTPVAPPPGTDLTTTARGSVASRYLVDLGQNNGSTVRPNLGAPQGIYEITNAGGNRADQANAANYWWKLNDGKVGHFGDLVTYGAPGPDYIGYKFKLPATVTAIEFWNEMFGDGGPFNAVPEVQYLTTMNGTTWQTIPPENLTWDHPYNTDPSGGLRRYVISIANPPTAIWGIRLYGQGAGGGDGDGFIGVTELTLYGNLVLTPALNLANNLARTVTGATPIRFPTGNGAIGLLNDGNLTTEANTYQPNAFVVTDGLLVDTFDCENFLGMSWTTPQDNVAALGVIFTGYRDGGYFRNGSSCDNANVCRIEYTTDPLVATSPTSTSIVWTAATPVGVDAEYPYGTDLGRYFGDVRTLHLMNWWPSTGFLFRFTPVSGITGLRIIGNPGGVGQDADGFVGAYELEVYGTN